MSPSKKYDERLNQILDVSETLFITKGYEKTTVNDILDELGIGKGTFYYYFKSKEGVMDAVIMRVVQNAQTAARAIADNPDLSAGEKFHRIIASQNTEGSHSAELVNELHQKDNSAMHQKSLVETILALSPILAEIVEQGIREGVCNTPDPQESVEFLFTAVQFLLDPGLFHWTPQELLKKTKAFVRITELVLGSPKGSFDFLLEIHEKALGETLSLPE